MGSVVRVRFRKSMSSLRASRASSSSSRQDKSPSLGTTSAVGQNIHMQGFSFNIINTWGPPHISQHPTMGLPWCISIYIIEISKLLNWMNIFMKLEYATKDFLKCHSPLSCGCRIRDCVWSVTEPFLLWHRYVTTYSASTLTPTRFVMLSHAVTAL